MKTLKCAALVLFTALSFLPRALFSEAQAPDASAGLLLLAQAVPVYHPPMRGAPGGRIGGGTRGDAESLNLSVLAPADHTGLTMHAQPSLYWFISSATTLPVELAVNDSDSLVLETRLPSPTLPGVQRIRLADYGVRLTTGVRYRWYVAVVGDANRRSRDILAGGTITRVDPPETLRVETTASDPKRLPFLYGDAGLWYDTVAAISELIEATPADTVLRKQRAALLEQVGLSDVAAFERKASP
jgi:hypothetical protein